MSEESFEDVMVGLNPGQRAAVEHVQGPLLILAGAGSGKTRVITCRIARLSKIAGVKPWHILAVTFTNKAAAEMRERTASLLGVSLSKVYKATDPWIGTFHALCARLLRWYGHHIAIPPRFTICDDSDQRQIFRLALQEVERDWETQEQRIVSSKIDDAKNQGHDAQMVLDLAKTAEDELCAEVYSAYQRILRAHNMLDFGDLILEAGRLLRDCPTVRRDLQSRWRYVMVDEFQDTNPAQYEVLRHLVGEDRNLAVVGDDDQAIYRWRGATVENILGFEKDYPAAQVVTLEQNYRSNQLILDAAAAVLEKVKRRRHKRLWSEQKEGAQVQLFTGRSARGEAAWVARTVQRLVMREGFEFDQCAVFYRTNAQSRAFEEQFRALGMPYQIIGGQSFYGRREVKDVLAYLKVALNPENSIDLKRVINTPRRGIGAKTVAKLEALVGAGGVVESLYDAVDFVVRAHGGDFTSRQRQRLTEFSEIIDLLKQLLDDGAGIAEILQEIIERTDYLAHLERTEPGSVEDRKQILEELIAAVLEVDESSAHHNNTREGIYEFLERSALMEQSEKSDEDDDLDELGLRSQPIKMMTVHAAKGLEFDCVCVVGLEDELFPLFYEGENRGGRESDEFHERLDEERRLFYVALTRARHRLFLSNARTRIVHGKPRFDLRSSRFLEEIPEALMTLSPETTQREIRWGWPTAQRADTGWRPRRSALKKSVPERERRLVVDDIEYEPGVFPGEATFEDLQVEVNEGWVPSYEEEVSPQADEASLIGRLVSHSREGLGEVLSAQGKGKKEKLRILFVSGVEMTIMRRFVRLM